MWRLWVLVAGLPLGVLVGRAVRGPQVEAPVLVAGGVLGALGLLALALLLARRFDDDPARGAHLARGATAAWVALPALGALVLGLGPGPVGWIALVGILLAGSLARRARRTGPSGGVAGVAASAALALVGGSVLVLAAAAVSAPLRAPAPQRGEWLEHASLDVDAGVPTRPVPVCGSGLAEVRVLADRGAHPRLEAGDEAVWLDAPGPDGRRQVHRLDLASGELDCATCGERGENRRPDPAPGRGAVLFETDRWSRATRPLDTEIHVVAARAGADGSRPSSRRLTFGATPDLHPRWDPSGSGLIWTRGEEGGSFAVVRAGLRSGHGGLLLSPPRVIASGGARFVTSLAWSGDARALVLGEGYAGAPWIARRLDPGLDEEVPIGELQSADFSADGSIVALAAPRSSGGVARGLRRTGALVERLRRGLGAEEGAAGTGTRVAVGRLAEDPPALELGEVADWGAPRGVALTADGRAVVLAQRRETPDGPQERVLWLERDCRTRAGAQAQDTGVAGPPR